MLTQGEIERDRAERARLGPIAAAVGLELDPHDRELTQALATIADRREELGVSSPPTSSASYGPLTARALQERDRLARQSGAPSAKQTFDMGEAVVERLKKRDIGAR